MASTPEGKVKTKVKDVLNRYDAYYFMPVQIGLGAAGLDFHCMARGGRAFFIETKAPGKKPTERQMELIAMLTKKGGKVFIIYDDVTLRELTDWLIEEVHNREARIIYERSRATSR